MRSDTGVLRGSHGDSIRGSQRESYRGSQRHSQRDSQRDSYRGSQVKSYRYSKVDSIQDNKRCNEQDGKEVSLRSRGVLERDYDSKEEDEQELEVVPHRQYSSDQDMFSEDNEQQEEPAINKTLVMLQKEMHKSLFSPSLMKINESPKVSLMTDRSK